MAVAVRKRVTSESRAPGQAVVLASADRAFRNRTAEHLRELRWTVYEVSGGAEAITLLEQEPVDALIVDNWLPDLEAVEFVDMVHTIFPEIEVIQPGVVISDSDRKGSRKNELLLVLQAGLENIQAERNCLDELDPSVRGSGVPTNTPVPAAPPRVSSEVEKIPCRVEQPIASLPEMVGDSPPMQRLSRLIRLVAPRSTTVLIQGPTGSGKELVAKAVHRLSSRAAKPFVTLNCAAIPESLLEAELFGHTRGAFTGAVQSRVGRVEAANGGTLFLDEIGEMPLALQAKMLRFLENGEIQRIGGNDTMRVDVRIVAATHQPLQLRAEQNAFRLDLYHRLAVFPVTVPPLQERIEDIPDLARFFLERLGEEAPKKRLSPAAERRLMDYEWPGNIRELAHVLERSTILAEDRPEIGADEIWF